MLKNFVFLCSLVLLNNFLCAEELDFQEIYAELKEAGNELQNELGSLEESDLAEAVIVDSALANMQDTIQFLEDSVENKNLDQTLTSLKFLDESLGNIASVIPAEIYNDMSNLNMESFGEGDLLAIKNISDTMNANQDTVFKEMVANMMTLEDQGFNAFNVFASLHDIGVTVDAIPVEIDSADNMKEWSIEEWANSWTGEVGTQRVDEIRNEDGTLRYVNLSDQEIVEMKAQMAMNFTSDVGFDAKEFNPNLSTSLDGKIIQFSGIDNAAAQRALESLAKNEEDWAAAWTGDDPGGVDDPAEIQRIKAEWAMNRAVQSIVENEEYNEVAGINVSELRDVASTFNVARVIEPKFESGFNNKAARVAIDSLNKSEADWAAAWTGDDPGGVDDLAEIQRIKAEWAMNRAVQSLMEGTNFSDEINIDQSELTQATTFAQENMQEQISAVAAEAAATAERIANFDTSGVPEELVESTKDLLETSTFAKSIISGGATNIAAIEEVLDISVESIVTDRSSWTEADWAAAWTGDEPGGYEDDAAATQRIKAEWAKNRIEQMDD